MSRKISELLEYGIEEEIDPNIKFNSLIGVAVSTIMCIAAKCSLPKSNVETTKLFLSTITNDDGQIPKNIKGFLSLLNQYTGPYDSDPTEESCPENPTVETETYTCERSSLESASETKSSGKEMSASVETQMLIKRSSRITVKKSERDNGRKLNKSLNERNRNNSRFHLQNS